MKRRSFLLLPRGTTDKRGNVSMYGRFLSGLLRRGGILLLTFFLMGQYTSISAKANGLSYQASDYDDGIPNEIREYCELVGTEYDICPELLEAMAYNESRFLPDVRNGNHYGLMQVNVKVHKKRIEKYGWTAEDMFDPYKNLMVAGDILHELYEMYGDDNPVVLAYYAGYSSTIKTYLKTGKMCSYAEKILENSAKYERLHGK